MNLRCPYPQGTVEYFKWWQLQHSVAIEEINRQLTIQELYRRELFAIRYGHDFDTHDWKCKHCQMPRIQYDALRPDQKTVCEGRLVKPKQKTPMLDWIGGMVFKPCESCEKKKRNINKQSFLCAGCQHNMEVIERLKEASNVKPASG